MKLVVAQKGSLDAAGPGIGTMASQDAGAVAITGGSIKVGALNLADLPTSPDGLTSGDVWKNGTFLVVVE